MQLKKGDNVKVISGSSRGKTGKVIRVLPEADRLIVEGANIRKKHTKPKAQGQKGQLVEFPASMRISNVMLVCPRCNEATRVGMRTEGDKKRRVCKQCNQTIE